MNQDSKGVIDSSLEVADAVQDVITDVEQGVEEMIAPVRRSIVQRFPVAFMLAVTAGVSLVFYSIEIILSRTAFVVEHPWLSLGIGIGILYITGTLYRKLS